MSALDTTEALAERERLQDEYRSAQSAADLHSANVGRAEARVQRLTRDRVAGYKARARGQEERVEEIEDELAEVEGTLSREQAAAQGALEARREVEDELERIRSKYLAEFAAEAEELTERAREAMAALALPYREAEAAWDRARAKWAPLAKAITAEMKEAREADGIYSAGSGDHQASTVPDFPLPSSGSVFERAEAGALAARPPALRPEGVSPQP